MVIRDAEPGDAAALRALHVVTWEQTYQEYARQPWYGTRLAAHRTRDWAEIIRSQRTCGGGLLIADCQGRIIGLCQYGPTADDDRDPSEVGEIQRLYVHPARQRAGIGRALLGAGLDRLRESRVSTATLWALETDGRARAFYEQLGWSADGARQTHPPTDVRYTLALTNNLGPPLGPRMRQDPCRKSRRR